MITTRTLLVGWCLLGGSAAFAQQEKGQPNFRDMFIKLDQNGDTILERDEIPETGRAAFDRLLKRGDANRDGKLSAEEMRVLGQKMQVLADPEAVAARFKGMDKDKDGKLTREEWTGVAMNFEKIDADKDGKITEPELLAFSTGRTPEAAKPSKPAEVKKPEPSKPSEKPKLANPAPAQPLQRFKQLDKDNDGKLSKQEFPRPKIFERLDADNDGFLTPMELAKLKDLM